MGTLFTALGAAAALAGTDIIPVHQGGARALGLTGAQLLTYVSGSYVAKAGGTMTGALSIASGTLTASAPALSITQTWTTGAAFTGAVMNITDTSSTSGSLLVDLQIASVSKFSVTKAGLVTAQNFVSPNFRVAIGDSYDLRIGSTSALIWCAGNITAAADLFLYRDAAATLAQRNGTTQQIFRLYNSYTDSSNFERLTLTGVAGTSVNITAETMGTGADNLDIVLTPAGTGSVYVPIGASAAPGIRFIGTDAGFWYEGGLLHCRGQNANAVNWAMSAAGTRYASDNFVGWASGSAYSTSADTALARNAAGIVEVNNGTAGTWRDLKLRNLIQTAYHEVAEMTAPAAPATNSVRIYAEDNGAGKTRLMALFATGSAVQIGIEP